MCLSLAIGNFQVAFYVFFFWCTTIHMDMSLICKTMNIQEKLFQYEKLCTEVTATRRWLFAHQYQPPSWNYYQVELILGSLVNDEWPIRTRLAIRDFCLSFAQTVDEPVSSNYIINNRFIIGQSKKRLKEKQVLFWMIIFYEV